MTTTAAVLPAAAFAPAEALPDQSAHGISLAEILSALSFALDLTEGAVPGHALRSCLLGMRLGKELGLTRSQRTSLYYALLLKDVGCSSNAARLCQIIGGGDERRVKAGVKLEDWTQPNRPKGSTLRLLWTSVLPHASRLQRIAGIVRIGLTQHRNNQEMITLRCDRGAHILQKLGLGRVAAEAVRGLDEHWDGSGYPERRTGHTIPVEARILAVAQHLDVFATERGTDAALAVLRERSRRWFDPELVRIVERLQGGGALWRSALATTPESETQRAVLDLAPQEAHRLQAADIDLICAAFADVVDAKSSFTFRHSLGVTEAAARIAHRLGLSPARLQLVYRAALLHDLGKLSVPNSILDKPGKLDPNEWRVVQEHPRLTREILARIGSFGELAEIAGAHHEKLDGSGYPNHLVARQLPMEARIIAVADVYGALTEDRPYRGGLTHEQAMEILLQDAPARLDPDCCEALMDGLR
ncbi:MAG TPA: HD domain-containing phosphohydrolase [Acidobacteriaceae bacterium]|nr:HD domain-containing phosphohydrolase [Acidobacteriaceae bacterium]